MRKILVALAAVVVTLAIAAPHFASAAEVQMTGIFRWRGVTGDDFDRNSRAHDASQFMDSLMRVRWTAISEGGKVFAIYELDGFDLDRTGVNGNVRFGSTTGRFGVGVNRWVIDFAIPGTTLRFRVGKTDWVDPTNEITGGAGLNRIQGYGVYGKLLGPLTMSLWTVKYAEGVARAADGDLYQLAINWKAAPKVTLSPFIMWDHLNTGCQSGSTACGAPATTSPDVNMWWYGLTARAKFGIASLTATGLIQDGEVQFGRGTATPDIDVEAWAALVRLWLSFGKLKIGFYGHFFSGDDDTTSAVSAGGTGTAALTGRQPDNKLTRFSGPRQNSTSRIVGPQLVTRRRFSTMAPVFGSENRPGGGNGGARMNGAHIYEILIKYKLTKKLTFDGNISLIRSAAKRANIDANFDGDTSDAGDSTYDSSKAFGTEIDLSLKYQIYKTLFTRLTFAYLFAGDYGKLATSGGTRVSVRDFDDTWALFSELRHYW